MGSLRYSIIKQYTNIPLEKIENEEYREIVEIVRYLEENYMPEEAIQNIAVRVENLLSNYRMK